MASIVRKKTETGVRHAIQLSPGENESRPKISLGKATKKQAETAKTNIENLVMCRNTGVVISPAAQEWLDGIADGLRKRLEVLKIIDPKDKGQSFTVAEWTNRYIKIRQADKGTKADTVRKMENVSRRLSVFFKSDKLMDVSVFQARNPVDIAWVRDDPDIDKAVALQNRRCRLAEHGSLDSSSHIIRSKTKPLCFYTSEPKTQRWARDHQTIKPSKVSTTPLTFRILSSI